MKQEQVSSMNSSTRVRYESWRITSMLSKMTYNDVWWYNILLFQSCSYRIELVAQSGIFLWVTKKRVPHFYGSTGDYMDDAIQGIIEKKIKVAQASELLIRLENVYKLSHLLHFFTHSIDCAMVWICWWFDSQINIQSAITALRAKEATHKAKEAPKCSRLITTEWKCKQED